MYTYHALQRTMERTGMDAKAAENFIISGIKKGTAAENLPAKERKHIVQKSQGGCRILVYNSYCFVVRSGNVCITVYQAPIWFYKTKYDGKQEIRNVRKYMRLNNLYEKEDSRYGFSEAS